MSDYKGKRYGTAGSGLGSDASQSRFGSSAKVGAAGERYLAALLRKNPSTKNYMMWSSLRIPASPGQKRYGGDVDLALASDRTIVLVDCKKWAAGHVYWSLFNKPMKGLSPMSDALSKNMDLAVNRYSEALPGHIVKGMVLFVPNQRGQLPTSVGLLRFPGGIRSFMPSDGMRKIARSLKKPAEPSSEIQALLGRMTK